MNFSNLYLAGKQDGKRVIQWPCAFFRAVLAAVGAVALFLTTYLVWFLLARPRSMGFLETWMDPRNHFGTGLLVFVAAVLALAVAAPLLWPVLLPVDGLPELSALPRSTRAGRLVLFGLACLATVVALFYAEENWRGKRAWDKFKSEVEAQGQRLEFSAFIPPPVANEENFAMIPLLAPLYDYKPGSQEWREPGACERAQTFARRYRAAEQLLDFAPWERGTNTWLLPWTPLRAWQAALLQATNPAAGSPRNQIPVTFAATNATLRDAAVGVLAALAESGPVIEELRAAARRPHARFNIPYDQEFSTGQFICLWHVNTLRNACEVLRLRASAELALGQTGATFADVQLILDLAETVRDEPFAFSFEIRTHSLSQCIQPLAEGLAAHQWSEAQLRAVEERLARLDLCADARRVLEAECASCVALVEHFRRSSNKRTFLARFGELVESHQARDVRVCAAAAPAGWSYREQIRLVSAIRNGVLPAIDTARRRVAPGEVRKAQQMLESVRAQSEWDSFFQHEFFLRAGNWWHWTMPAERAARTQAALDAARLACALERCRLARGELPESLDALVPQFVAKLPPDIINGEPLKYRRTEGGQFVLYSVGWNGTDEGGVVPKDWVWRSLQEPGN